MNVRKTLTLFLFAYLAIGCGGEEEVKQEVIRPVKYAVIQPHGGILNKTFSGTAKAANTSNLSFRANGILVELNVKLGDPVKKGQLIAQLDDTDARLALEQTKASLESAKVQAQVAKSNFDRISELYIANNISLSDYEQAKNNNSAANSTLQTAQKSVDLQKSQLEYYQVFAPIQGTITALNAERNEFIQAGAPIVTISNEEGGIEIQVKVPENVISSIKRDDEVDISFSSLENQEFKGRVSEISYAADASSTYPVIIQVVDATKAILAGMSSDVTFEGSSDHDETSHLIVPMKAVGEGPEGQFVFALKKAGDNVYTIERKSIEIGHIHEDGFEIKSGLEQGDLVATAGLNILLPGMKVKLLEQ